MSWLAGWRQRIYEALRPARAADDVREELQSHVEHELARQLRDGVPPDEARRRAAIRAGNPRAAQEAVRDEQTGRLVADALADLRVAGRAVRRDPGFASAVILSLALGVGGTTAVFGVVNAVLLRPLPYSDPDRLFAVRVWWNDFSARLSPADLVALEEESAGVATVAAFFRPDDGFALTTPAGPALVEGAIVTGMLPALLGVAPIAGAGFSSQPDAPEALIGEALWRERYQASTAAIGRRIVLDGDAYSVMGVMPAGFNVPGQRDGVVWLKALTPRPTRRGPFYFYTLARLAPHVSVEIAAERLTTNVARVLRDHYAVEPNWRYGLQPLKAVLVGDVGGTLWLLLGTMGLVLLIAIVNVANLLLARGTGRRRELAVRSALGAGRGRLARHLLVESAVLGVLGGALAIALAWALLRVAGRAVTRVLPLVPELGVDPTMIAFALGCGVAAALLAGLAPLVSTPWRRLAEPLRDSGRGAGDAPTASAARQALVVVEIALTVSVLTGAALLGKSLLRLQAVDPGFNANGVATFRLSLPDDPYEDEARRVAFLEALDAELRSTPAAAAVAFAQSLPPDLLAMSNNYTVEGAVPGTAGSGGVAEWNVVSRDYFAAMSIRLLRGRAFATSDRPASPRVAIVNDAFVRRHFPDGDALGRRFKSGDWDAAGEWTTIVGVVADVPYGKGVWGGADATLYVAHTQNAGLRSPYVVIKAGVDPALTLTAASEAVKALDRSLPLRDAASMEARLRSSMVEPRLRSILFALIAGLALAVTGIYGVMAYRVNQRRRETAIRRALGATTRDVVSAILVGGLRLTLAGIAFGAAGAYFLTRSLSSMLFQVSARDPGALMLVAALLGVAALLACALPAMRTALIDPAAVLREE